MSKPWQVKVADYIKRPVHKLRSQTVDLSKIETVCMALGPNRNMTTLTASLIALHPQCQVLNNAGYRIMDNALAALRVPGEQTHRTFARDALFKSQGGRRGHYGGTITLSHAFDRPAVRDAYERRYGRSVLKQDVRCIYWKSAVQLTSEVRGRGIDLGAAVAANPKLRFLMPIRNPLDCAKSNFRLGHYRHFPEAKDEPVEGVVRFFVELVGWFLDLRADHPDNFFCYFEQEYGPQTLEELARFLKVDVDPTWISDCAASRLKGRAYDYEPALLDAYHGALDQFLGRHPEAKAKLASLAPVG